MFSRLLVLIALSFLFVHSLDVIVENGTIVHFNTPAFSGNKSPIIDGNIISYLGLLGTTAKDLQACDKVSPSARVNQSIALLAPYGGCSTERHIEVAQNAGALAVIVITDQVWKICRTTDVRSSHFKNNINAICISTQDFAELSKIMIANGNKDPPQPTMAIFGSDPSEYNTKLNRRLINFGTITFFIVYILLSALAVYRLVKFFVKEGFRITIPKFLLAYVVYAGIVLAITVIDLQGYRDWYNTMQFQTTYYFFFSSAVLYIFIIFSAYVANILAKVSQHYKMLKMINYVITGIFLVFFTISNIVFSVYGYSWNFGEVQSRAVIIIISIILGSCGLFFLFCSIILVTKLSSFVGLSSAKSQTRRKKYIFLSIILFVAFLNNFLGFSITVAIAFKSIQNDIQSFFLLYFLYNVTCVVWLILLLLVFNPKKNLGKPSTSSFNFKKSSTEPFQTSMH